MFLVGPWRKDGGCLVIGQRCENRARAILRLLGSCNLHNLQLLYLIATGATDATPERPGVPRRFRCPYLGYRCRTPAPWNFLPTTHRRPLPPLLPKRHHRFERHDINCQNKSPLLQRYGSRSPSAEPSCIFNGHDGSGIFNGPDGT